MTEMVFLIEDDPDGGYIAHALGESIFTQAETRDALTTAIRDAVRCHYDRPEDAPTILRLHYVQDEVVAL